MGFTLVELLIVIVILGVLAAIVVFSVVGITDRGKTAACQSDKATLTSAVEAFYAKHQYYPPNVDPTLTAGDDKFLNGVPANATYTPVPAGAAQPSSYTIGPASC
ncbi:MAG TPA: prepilin-type N-terminal cleavage/methylation domain-containing protein [Amycolatopsis sp.]|nr:prepilin-type N-terminal cleavage/methylation domain-containing protein [Amycolatopsis sp.]